MTDSKKRGRKRKEEFGEEPVQSEPSKEEYKLADWMRKNVPIKRTKFVVHSVEYFTGTKAVDLIWNSPWSVPYAESAEKKSKIQPLFQSREDILNYLDVMLHNKFFHRAKKVPITSRDLGRKVKKDVVTHTEVSSSVSKSTDTEAKKKTCKVRLEMHLEQHFEDNLDAYVWIYQPTPFHYWVVGTLLVLGGIVLCMFPLWPPMLRQGVYYTSMAAICFLVLIIVLACFRHVLFSLVWICTFGRHHFWLLPNLTEDVGFVASFIPVYKYEYKGPVELTKPQKKSSKKANKKDKNSDAEVDSESEESKKVKKADKVNLSKNNSNDNRVENRVQNGEEAEEENTVTEPRDDCDNSNSNSNSNNDSERSSSSDRDFEMVNAVDVETHHS